MIQPICKDVIFLGRPSRMAAREDLPIGEDLLDTLRAHRQGCVGMAANMIGQAVRIIAVDQDGTQSGRDCFLQPPFWRPHSVPEAAYFFHR